MFLFILMLFSVSIPSLESTGKYQRFFNGALQSVRDYRQEGNQIKILKGSSLISCAQLCLAEPYCVSTNFGISSENQPVCELNHASALPLASALIYSKEFIFSYYSEKYELGSDIQEDCRQINCLHDGRCLFNHPNEKFYCVCIMPWTGERCETKIDHQYKFTALGAKGPRGPNSNEKYNGTSLEGITVKNGLQTWLVPFTAYYNISVCGATGGDANLYGTKGGRGAKVQGNIHLQKGIRLTVLVGQRGSGGGGGGGSYVIFADNSTPLVVAGGGGAADYVDGDPGQGGRKGSVNGGRRGNGGKVCVTGDPLISSLLGIGAGSGFKEDGHCFENGVCDGPCVQNDGGKSFVSGGEGGLSKRSVSNCAGGFGGGGNCGGGGGYSGGGVEVDCKSQNFDYHAGGGGSFFPDADWSAVSGGCIEKDGFVLFDMFAWTNT